MYYQLRSYLKFLSKSTNAHGVHSPFVFDLVTKCFYDNTKYSDYDLLQEHRRSLSKDESTINVNDFGAGSRVFKSNKRKVNAIARTAGIPWKRQKLLYRISRYFAFSEILELGTSLGLATMALSLGNRDAKIVSVEGCSETAAKASEYLSVLKTQNIELKVSTFEAYFESLVSEKFDLIYMDGNHSKQRTLDYFDEILPRIHHQSVIILDDIYWSKEMTEAWEILRRQLKVSVSIDTFHWGILFFRREQPKQHFHIRL